MGKHSLIINKNDCMGCHACEVACKQEHGLNVGPRLIRIIEKDPDFEDLRNGFRTAGFSNVTILHTRDRDVANSHDFYNTVAQAKGIWFSSSKPFNVRI